MGSFSGSRLGSLALPADLTALLGGLKTAGQRNAPFFERPNAVMQDGMAGQAAQDSVVSSNRMEGVLVHPHRLGPLMAGTESPSGRSEQEIWNYREALWRVHGSHRSMLPAPKDLQALHARLRVGFKGASEWRSAEAEAEAAELCEQYSAFRAAGGFQRRFLAAAAFTLDFDTLRPFRDDAPRSRLTRLLTVLSLYKAGLTLAYYVSVERLMEASKVEYAAALKASSKGWKEGRHDVRPWLAYLAVIVKWAYWEFETVAYPARPRGTPEFLALEAEEAPPEHGSSSKGGRPAGRAEDLTPRVLAAVDGMPKVFTLGDVKEACPEAGHSLITKVLGKLRDEGLLRLIGNGRGAKWEKTEKYAERLPPAPP